MVAAAVHEIAPGVTRVFEPAEVRELEGLIAELGRIDGSVGERALDDDAVRVDQIDLLERLKAAAEAARWSTSGCVPPPWWRAPPRSCSS